MPARDTIPVRPSVHATATTGSGTLVVRRDGGNYRWYCETSVSVDGKLAGKLQPKEELRFQLPLTEEFVVTVVDCRSRVAETPVVAVAEKPKAYRVGFDDDGVFVRQTVY